MKDLSQSSDCFSQGDHASPPVASPLDALKQLNETVTEALLAYLREQPETAKDLLKLALPQLLRTMMAVGVDPVDPSDEPEDENQDPGQRLVHIDGNRVQFRVNDQLRGSWSIWSVGDLKEVCRLAEEFDCGLVYSFIGSLSPSRIAESRYFDQGELLGSGDPDSDEVTPPGQDPLAS
jgi:hypothetical protein